VNICNIVLASKTRWQSEDDFFWIAPITQNAYSVFGRKYNQQDSSIDAINQLLSQRLTAFLAGDFSEQVIINAAHVALAKITWQVALQEFLSVNLIICFPRMA
jgi:hypothetical protein